MNPDDITPGKAGEGGEEGVKSHFESRLELFMLCHHKL